MTTLPLWAVYAVGFGTPLCALLGVLLTLWLTRRSARELDARATREELMRHVRWATDLAVDDDHHRDKVGLDQLLALGRSKLVDSLGQSQIDAALASVVLRPREEVHDLEARGFHPEVVPLETPHAGRQTTADDVRSTSGRGRKDGEA